MSEIQGWGEKLYILIPSHLLFVESVGITLQSFDVFCLLNGLEILLKFWATVL